MIHNAASLILKGIGAPITKNNLAVMTAWAAAEGGNTRYNPFNTTQNAPGATNYNSVGVKNYTNAGQGINATVQTLLNGHYNDLVANFRKNANPYVTASTPSLSTWGTGNFSTVLKSVLASPGQYQKFWTQKGFGNVNIPAQSAVQPSSMAGTPGARTLASTQSGGGPNQAANLSSKDALLQSLGENIHSYLGDDPQQSSTFLTTLLNQPIPSPTGTQLSGPGIPVQVTHNNALSPNAVSAIKVARQYLNTPYVWGGANPKTGFDCSGLLQYSYGKVGIKIPRTSQQQYAAAQKVPRGQLMPGDAVFFKGSDGTWQAPGHVGLYIGHNQYIEAPHTGDVVKIANLSQASDFISGGRFK